jgi:hypothetical protein
MKTITHENYEAFYLDYLEGNLSEDVRLLFLDFLTKNPTLQLSDDSIPVIETTETTIDKEFKTTLYQINTAYAPINHSNYSVFLLAAIENELTPEKTAELNAFLAQNDLAQKEFEQLKMTKLSPDLSQKFPDKKTLKKAVFKPLWPIYSALAAACLIGFFILTQVFSSNSVLNSSKKTLVHLTKKTVEKLENKNTLTNSTKNNLPKIERTSSKQVLKNELPKVAIHIHEMPPRDCIVQLEMPENSTIAAQITPVTPATNKAENLTENQEIASNQTKSDEMRNPIQPITNRLGNLLNKEVDFKISKKTDDSKRGFLIKIGEFEISHNKK